MNLHVPESGRVFQKVLLQEAEGHVLRVDKEDVAA